jgi:hypothetical protein
VAPNACLHRFRVGSSQGRLAESLIVLCSLALHSPQLTDINHTALTTHLFVTRIALQTYTLAENLHTPDPRFEGVKNFIRSGAFGDYDYSELLGSLEGNTGFGKGDYFLVGHDFPSYIECQDKVDKAYRDQEVRSLNPKHSVFSTVINTTALGNNFGVID